MKFKFEYIQQLGRALMLPIALLPLAGLLLRFGQPDLLNLSYIAAAGNVIFTHLPLLFALGVAVGIAKDNNGTAALAATVGYLVMTTILTTINKDLDTAVLGGILIGVIAGALYNKFKDIQLPEYLAFFGGKRFVPIITGLVAVFVGILLGYIWPPIQNGIAIWSQWIIKHGAFGVFIYGVMNRFLLITGLHHVINNIVWFVLGSYQNPAGVIVHGDIARFMAGDKTAGIFMAGFFPVFMFGLPAACLAMYKHVPTENKKAVAGMLLSMALTSFLTGVTEPIEFAFMFVAPILYVIHALLTGLSMYIMYILNVHLGFTFSAGLIDYVLFFKYAQNPLYVIPFGILYALIYYFLFDFCIRIFNLATLGRETKVNVQMSSIINSDSVALQFIKYLGGSENLISIDACTVRLRLTMLDSANINKDMLIALGAMGIIAPSKSTLQVILGLKAEIIASDMRIALADNHVILGVIHNHLPTTSANNQLLMPQSIYEHDNMQLSTQLINAFGKDNIKVLSVVALTRLDVVILEPQKLTLQNLSQEVQQKIIHLTDKHKQIYIGGNAQQIYTEMRKIINF